MTVSTTNYEFTWGRKPRGRGHWAFQFFSDIEIGLFWAPCEMTYSEAKRWAIKRCKEVGGSGIAVAT
jgi:hypothetical protein